ATGPAVPGSTDSAVASAARCTQRCPGSPRAIPSRPIIKVGDILLNKYLEHAYISPCGIHTARETSAGAPVSTGDEGSGCAPARHLRRAGGKPRQTIICR